MASARLRSWVRKRWAWITMTPSYGHALSGQTIEPQRSVPPQRDLARVEAQLGCGGELVDVLTARTGGANEKSITMVVLVDVRSREIRSMASPGK